MTRSSDDAAARVLLALLALALVGAAVAHGWLAHLQPTAAMGLWGMEVCVNGCASARWDNTPVGFEVVLAGYTATIASLVGAGLALAAALRPTTRSHAARARRALTVALIAMAAWFVVLYLFGAIQGMTALSPDWAIFVGPAAAAGARWLVTRAAR